MDFDINNIKVIVCLGNIGREYDFTRHNAGFIFAELVCKGFEGIKEERKLKSFVKQIMIKDQKIYVTLPTTMMNISGDAAQLILSYYKVKPEQMLVAHDDLDIPLGKTKLQFAKGPYIHNGVTDIENKLSSEKFWRLRIGVDNRTDEQRNNITGRAYVLMNMAEDEIETMKNTLLQTIQTHFT